MPPDSPAPIASPRRPGLRRIGALIGWALAVALPAAAFAESPAVEKGVGLYEFGDYPGSARALEQALADGLPEQADRTRARLYLASALHAQGEADRARRVLDSMLFEDPSARVDPALFPPKLVELFQEVKAACGPSPAPPALADDRPLAVPPPPPPPLVLEPKREPAPLALAFVPFGVGQFANGSPKKGAFFLGSEVLAYGLAAVALTAFESKKLPGSPGPLQCTLDNPCRFSDDLEAQRLQATYVAAFWTGVALTAIGIGEAVVENRAIAAER